MSKTPTSIAFDTLRTMIADSTIAFGIPAFNEGEGILPTLCSLWECLSSLQLGDCQLIVSESHLEASLSSAKSAERWAASVNANLDIQSANRRRPKKEALNHIFDLADSDVLIILDADVVVPRDSLVAMLYHLFNSPRPIAVSGAAVPDPAASGLNYRAGAWQLRASARAASYAPRLVDPEAPHVHGTFWGSWRTFYSSYRFAVGSGSLAEDVEIGRALSAGGYSCLNVPEAFVYCVPPGSLSDLCLGTLRSDVALDGRKRGANEYLAAALEAAADPVGAALYGWSRIWCRYSRSALLSRSATEDWQMLSSTKRKGG
jgi:cellulose synthase/poly-beta-1,6-N-acetylglucosamine synthase-like glycosyltransferase